MIRTQRNLSYLDSTRANTLLPLLQKGSEMKNTLIVLTMLCAARVSAQTVVQQFVAVSRGAGTVSDMDLQPTVEGSTLIAMPFELTPGIKVLSVTDNAPDGGNTYKEVSGSAASCQGQSLSLWYCEKCNSGVTELKFHL